MPASASFCAARDVGRETLHAVAFSLRTFSDHGKRRGLTGPSYTFKANDLLA